jgi:hypothetical protein
MMTVNFLFGQLTRAGAAEFLCSSALHPFPAGSKTEPAFLARRYFCETRLYPDIPLFSLYISMLCGFSQYRPLLQKAKNRKLENAKAAGRTEDIFLGKAFKSAPSFLFRKAAPARSPDKAIYKKEGNHGLS